MSRELDAKVAERIFGWHIFRVGYEGTDDETPEQRKYEAEFQKGSFGVVGWYAFIPEGKEVVRWDDGSRQYYRFTTDASWDYEVLKHALETWAGEQWAAFKEALDGILGERSGIHHEWSNVIFYQPGDYSKAALLALGEKIE